MSRTRLAAACLGILVLTACEGVTGPGEHAQGKVVFLRYMDPDRRSSVDSVDVYVVNADGTGLQNLTNHPARYRNVSASPDGRKVAFESDRGGAYWERYIWVMNIDGTELRQFTTEYSSAPRWSPDGTRIAFEMVDGDDLLHVYVSNADFTNLTKVSGPAMQVGNTCGTSTTRSNIELVGWVGNGRVAFARYYCGFGYRNFLVNPDGSGFTQTDIRLWNAHFSPDGSQVVVSRYEGSWKVVLMNADGTGARVLSTQGVQQGLPANNRFRGGYSAWSPDGKRILFFAETSSGSFGNEPQSCSDGALPYVVNVDGSGVQRLMDSCVGGSFNGWSRSGEQVAFTMWTESGFSDVYAVKADGTGTVNLTNSPFWEMEAEWLPRE